MRKLFFTAAVIATMVFAGCKKENTSENEALTGTYIGTLEVAGSEPFTDSDIEWVLEEQSDNTYTLYMNKTRFSSRMPVYLDMEVRDMKNQGTASVFRYETASIIPYYNGLKQEDRVMTDVRCEADEQHMEVTFTCMGMNATYRGIAK